MFQVQVKQSDLMIALKRLKLTVGKGKDDAYNKCIYMQAEKGATSNYLRVITSNGNEIGTVFCKIDDCDLAVCSIVDFTLFSNIISTINADTILDIKDCGDKIEINYEGRKKPITIAASNSNLYKYNGERGEILFEVSLNAREFKELVEKANNIISQHEDAKVYNCIHFSFSNGLIIVKGMDAISTKRMFLYSKVTEAVGNGEFFLNAEKTKKMLSAFDNDKDIKLFIYNNIVTLKQSIVEFSLRRVFGEFAPIENFMPNDYKINSLFDGEELLSSLKRIKALGTEDTGDTCTLSIGTNSSEIERKTSNGSILENLKTASDNEGMSVCLSIDALISTVESIGKKVIKISFNDNKYCVMQPGTNELYVHRILVPCRVKR